ncbi:MAG: DUF4167 domain-containing protein [Rhodobacteraceae bacterium]|nr:DUF4167 domain-containing protein [Paracoccaceae bacterium]
MRNSRGSRPRGKGRKGNTGNGTNRVFESSGPDGKVRGNSLQIIEKYQAHARDSLLGGDRIVAENFTQHAEHYIRLLESQKEFEIQRSSHNVHRMVNGKKNLNKEKKEAEAQVDASQQVSIN